MNYVFRKVGNAKVYQFRHLGFESQVVLKNIPAEKVHYGFGQNYYLYGCIVKSNKRNYRTMGKINKKIMLDKSDKLDALQVAVENTIRMFKIK